jgi:Tol biopolymer transport system component
MKRIPVIAMLVVASGTVVALAWTAPVPRRGAQSVPAAKITTIATFPGVSATEVAAGAHGNLLYMTTDSGVVLVYDRAQRKTSVAVKGDFNGVVTSATGDHLGLLRPAEDKNSRNMWTVAVDPKTGIATGAPRRVSLMDAGAMRISPDGKEIAFISYAKLKSTVFVVPFNAGKERVVAEGLFDSPIRYSPDGKWIYVVKWTMLGSTYVARIPAGGGDAVEVTPSVKEATPGITPDGRYVVALTAEKALNMTYTVFDANKQKVGDVGVKFPVDGARIDYAWTHDGYHQVWALKTASVVAHAADYAGTANRVIPGINGPNTTLSPDGKSILSDEFDGKNGMQIVLRNADGSNPRVLAPIGLTQFESLHWHRLNSPWSPDGRYVTYETDTLQALMVYDTKTGKSKEIAHTDQMIRQAHFRSDGKAVLYVAFAGMPPMTVTVREATLEGKERVLRDISTEAPGGGDFLDDSILYSGRLAKLLPFGGTPRPLFEVVPENTAVPPISSNPFRPSASPDGRLLARTAVNRKGIDLAAIDGSSKRTLPVSFAFDQGNPVRFHPNGREIIAPVAASDGSPAGLMAVPLDGSVPRRLVTFAKNETLMSYSISSDGKTILYVVSGASATVLYDVDLSPGISGKH